MRDERMRQSQIQHIGRMNSILACSETSSNVAKTNSDMVSADQAKEVNMLSGQFVISNPATGENYQVGPRPGNYWVNSNAEYFGTKNVLYDPNPYATTTALSTRARAITQSAGIPLNLPPHSAK